MIKWIVIGGLVVCAIVWVPEFLSGIAIGALLVLTFLGWYEVRQVRRAMEELCRMADDAETIDAESSESSE